jgi:hypothetical protein
MIARRLTASWRSTRFVTSASAVAPTRDAGVVDEHVEAAEALLVGCDDALDVVLVGHVAGDFLDLRPGLPELLDGAAELVGAPGGGGDGVALPAEHPGDGEPDPARGSGDDRGTIGH